MSHFDICLKQKIFLIFFDPILDIFKIIGLIFFFELAMKNFAMNMHFNPIPIL